VRVRGAPRDAARRARVGDGKAGDPVEACRVRTASAAERSDLGAARRGASAATGPPAQRLVELYDELSRAARRPGARASRWSRSAGSAGARSPPGSDLDLLLVHAGRPDVGAVADALWYPLWDSGVGVDHSVRTVPEALAVAAGDLKAALGLLDARHVAGDPALTADLLTRTRAAWRAGAATRLPELRAAVLERACTDGEVAFLLEPDLKSARGGLRDVHALQALAAAQVADSPGEPVRAALEVLLDVRGELHRRTAGPAGGWSTGCCCRSRTPWRPRCPTPTPTR
jgi:[protein-PII] uridylyltransferase